MLSTNEVGLRPLEKHELVTVHGGTGLIYLVIARHLAIEAIKDFAGGFVEGFRDAIAD